MIIGNVGGPSDLGPHVTNSPSKCGRGFHGDSHITFHPTLIHEAPSISLPLDEEAIEERIISKVSLVC